MIFSLYSNLVGYFGNGRVEVRNSFCDSEQCISKIDIEICFRDFQALLLLVMATKIDLEVVQGLIRQHEDRECLVLNHRGIKKMEP